MNEITQADLDALTAFDTPTICNALEIVQPNAPRRGFTVRPLLCGFPDLPPIVGYARTATIRAKDPPAGSAWAANSKPIPPGPGNPLGTRWMGLSAPGVGIHGTPDAASIGYSASHGCIRMRIPDAEWLFQHVKIGTPVFIVSK